MDNLTECSFENTTACIKDCHECKFGEHMCALRVSGTRGTKNIAVYVKGYIIHMESKHVEDMTDKVKRKEVRKALQKAEKLRMKTIERRAKDERRRFAAQERAVSALNKRKLLGGNTQ